MLGTLNVVPLHDGNPCTHHSEIAIFDYVAKSVSFAMGEEGDLRRSRWMFINRTIDMALLDCSNTTDGSQQ